MRFFDLIRRNDNYKIIVGVIVGAIIFGGGVYAANVSGSDVSYKNSSSGLDATNVQKAVDAIYEKAKTKGIPSPSSFSTDSWSTIALAAKMSKYPYQEYPYKVGDTKTVDMGGFGTHTVRIANLTTCSYYSQTACGFVIEFSDLVIIRRQMNSTKTNVGGWASSDLRKYLNDTVFKSLPDTLQQIIIKTTVVSGHGSTDKYNNSSKDKLYLLSSTEVYGGSIASDTASSTTRQLDYYKNKGVTTSNYSGAIKQNGAAPWGLRTAWSDYDNIFSAVAANGSLGYFYATDPPGVSPAFRIA